MPLNAGDTLLNGQYQILRQIGKGGFGFVYYAHDTLLGERMAIKELIPSLVGNDMMLKRFLAEARATMRLTHERIVRTHSVFSESGNYYIAMEYMAGGSLSAYLDRQAAISPEDAVRIASQVCEGLHYAHQRGVVHCDLKPANILFAADGSAKVADFGIAHISDQLLDRTWHTMAGFVAGTLPYMSPEQADGVRDDPRIDVYALGAVLYRVLTGHTYLYFDQRDTPGATADNVQRLRSERARPPSSHTAQIPPWLDQIILKALAKRPDDRFASALELRQALISGAATGAATAPAFRGTPDPPAQASRSARPVAERPARAQPSRSTPPPSSKPMTSSGRRSSLPGWVWALAGAVLLLCGVLIVITALLLSGDGPGQETPVVTMVILPDDTPTLAPTDLPEPTVVLPTPEPTVALPTLEPAGVIVQEDFSDSNSGWAIYEDAEMLTGYVQGEYRVAVYSPDLVAWGSVDVEPDISDGEFEVEVRHVEGPEDNGMGLLIRYDALTDSFYRFQISSDGYYAVDLLLFGEFQELVPWTTSDVINLGLGASNHLRVVAEGSQFRFFVNDYLLADVEDGTLISGDIGLCASAFEATGVAVHFDNMIVRTVPEPLP